MSIFPKQMKGRAWVATIHIANMKKAGLSVEEYETPEKLAEVFTMIWNNSGKNRSCGIAVCISEQGTYHAHMALYGNTTTLGNVSKILFDSHVEPQMGGKKELTEYLKKEGKYAEKEEKVLYVMGLDSIQDVQGSRSDLDRIQEYIEKGLTPPEIMKIDIRYRMYEKMIKSAFIDKRIQDTPLIKEMHNEWHCGESGAGKSYYYYELCKKHSPEEIYLVTDFESGGFDYYIEQGAPPILFMDEFKGNMKFSQLLTILDKYSRTQTHCRYSNTYNLWTTCIITSIFSPDEVYASMVENNRQNRDKIDQLLRRLDCIVYHYKTVSGEYKAYSMPASEYVDYRDLKQRALRAEDGFIYVDDMKGIPFKE